MKQITAPQTNMFACQQENTATMKKKLFYAVHVEILQAGSVSSYSQRTVGFSRCELLLLEAGSWGRGQFRNPEEGEHPLLEAGTKQQQWRHGCGH
jgi:hypothetical protein